MSNTFEKVTVSSGMTIPACFVEALKKRNITEPTDIQKKVIPLLAEGQNVFFTSATGTGKTFAYLLPILGNISRRDAGDAEGRKRELLFLIVAPTLELCTQIKGELDFLLESTEIRSALLIGSVNIERQIENLKETKPNIIVGNPNRLLVLAQKKLIKFNDLSYLVLDEADRLVSDEMIDDTNALLTLVRRFANRDGKHFKFAACSATINKKNADKLSDILGGASAYIDSQDNEILRDKIEHWAIFSEKRRKEQTLRSLLAALTGTSGTAAKKQAKKQKKSGAKILVFTSKGDEAAIMLSRLQFHHIAAVGLFGKAGKKPLSAQERKEALESFRSGSSSVLISTDLAARGLDIPGITHVVSLDVPSDSEVYIHRCGRTARAGKRGVMVTIGDETQMRLLAAMEKKLKIKIYPKELHYGQIFAPEDIIDDED